MFRLMLATRNAHKTREFSELLGPDWEVTDLSNALHVPTVEETGRTFEENAVLKAVSVSRVVPEVVVADDSGLEVEALGGAPGVYSARYAGDEANDQENVSKLLAELELDKRENAGRRARFRCALAVAADGNLLAVVHGDVTGVIAEFPRGRFGFGYDPVFVPTGFDQTFAELGADLKNEISHRAVAINKLRQRLPGLCR